MPYLPLEGRFLLVVPVNLRVGSHASFPLWGCPRVVVLLPALCLPHARFCLFLEHVVLVKGTVNGEVKRASFVNIIAYLLHFVWIIRC